jgi:putative aldouronate transport system permease protein
MIHLTDQLDSTPKSAAAPSSGAGIVYRSSAKLNGFQRLKRSLDRNGTLMLMALPGLLLLFIFHYLPLPGLVIAFKNYKTGIGIWGSEWVGFKNFEFLFGTDTAWRITANTLFLNAIFITTGVIASLTIALLLNEIRARFMARFYQSSVFFPHFVSWVIVGYFGFAFLNGDSGLLNKWMVQLGLDPVGWYSSPDYWPYILTAANIWKTAGYWSIIYLAGMLGISTEYYEAAMIDGASRWQQIVSITLPLLLPLVIINVLLSIGRIFYADFGLFYYVTRDSSLLYRTTDVIDTYIFRSLRSLGDFSMATAAGFYQSFVGLVLVFLANWAVRRIDPEKSIF